MSKPEEIRFAILGAGVAAEYHQQAIAANENLEARLIAVGHYDPARFDEISGQFDVPCMTYEEILSDARVDSICICTPSGQHADQAVAAAHAGKHVLVEKPIALTVADADRMIAACEQANVKLGVALQRRAMPLFRRIRDAIVHGDLGPLTLGQITIPYHRPQTYFDQAAWRGTWAQDGGGVIMNQGIHLVDLLVWYMGDPVAIDTYAATLHRDVEVEDTLVALLRFADGAMATITATTTASPGFPHRLEIYGTDGGIQIEGETIRQWKLSEISKAAVTPLPPGPTAGPGAASHPRGIAPTGHIGILRDFIEAIRSDQTPMVDGAEGKRSVKTVLAIYDAADLR